MKKFLIFMLIFLNSCDSHVVPVKKSRTGTCHEWDLNIMSKLSILKFFNQWMNALKVAEDFQKENNNDNRTLITYT